MRAFFTRLPWRRKSPLLTAEEFTLLCQEEIPHLLRLARRLTSGDDDAAQDLVQETMVRSLEAFLRDDYAERGNLRAYLMRILTNRFLNLNQRERRHPTVSLDEISPDGETFPEALVTHSTEATLLTQVMDEPLERALSALPAGLRAAILLVDVEGLEYAEAARALGIPVGTIRSRLFRARQLLYQALLPCAITQGWIVTQEVLP